VTGCLAQICGNFAGSSAPSSSKYGNIERAALPNGTLESQLATTVRQWRLIRGVSNSLDQYTWLVFCGVRAVSMHYNGANTGFLNRGSDV